MIRKYLHIVLVVLPILVFGQGVSPDYSVGFPPDSSGLYLLGIDTTSSSVKFGRGKWLDSTYLANALGVGAPVGGNTNTQIDSFTVRNDTLWGYVYNIVSSTLIDSVYAYPLPGSADGNGLYDPATDGDTLGASTHRLVIPADDTLMWVMGGGLGLSGNEAMMMWSDSATTGDPTLRLGLHTATDWRLTANRFGGDFGFIEVGNSAIWSADQSLTMTTEDDLIIETTVADDLIIRTPKNSVALNTLSSLGFLNFQADVNASGTSTHGLVADPTFSAVASIGQGAYTQDSANWIGAGEAGAIFHADHYTFGNTGFGLLGALGHTIKAPPAGTDDTLMTFDADGVWGARSQSTITGDTSILATQYWVTTNTTATDSNGVFDPDNNGRNFGINAIGQPDDLTWTGDKANNLYLLDHGRIELEAESTGGNISELVVQASDVIASNYATLQSTTTDGAFGVEIGDNYETMRIGQIGLTGRPQIRFDDQDGLFFEMDGPSGGQYSFGDGAGLYLPPLDNTLDTILAIDPANGMIHMIEASSIGGGTDYNGNIYRQDSTVGTGRTATLTDSLMFDFSDGGKFELGYDIAGSQNVRLWESGSGAPAFIYWQNSTTGSTFLDGAFIGMNSSERLELYSENRIILTSDTEFQLDVLDINQSTGTAGQVLQSNGGADAGVEWVDVSSLSGVGVYAQENNGTATQVDTLDFQTGLDVTFGSGDADITFDPSEFNIVTADTSADYFLISDGSDLGQAKRVDVGNLLKDYIDVPTTDTYAEIQVDGVAVSDAAPTLDFDNTDFSLVESPTNDFDVTIRSERIEDIVGGMVTGNTETLIAVTYQDVDGTLDFVVNDDLSLYDNSTSGFLTTEVDGSVTNEAWTIDGDDLDTEVISNQTVLFAGGTDITTDYNPATNTMTIDYTGSTGISGIRIEDGGASVVDPATAINFNTGFEVTNAGSGEATVIHDWGEFTTATTPETDDYFMLWDQGLDAEQKITRANVQSWIESFVGTSQWTASGSDIYPSGGTSISVGIGTTTPSAKLHVATTSGDANVRISTAGASTADEAILQFFDGATADGFISMEEQSGGDTEMSFWLESEEILTLREDAPNWSNSDAQIEMFAGFTNTNWLNISVSTTLDEGHYGVRATSSGITVTMPSLAAFIAGNQYVIYNASSGTITVDPGTGSDNFNGSTANIILQPNESIMCIATNTSSLSVTDWITFD